MHLHTVHTSSYYSASPATTNTTSMRPCLNVSMISRVMHGVSKCISAVSTSNSSTASQTHFTTLHASGTGAFEPESKGLSRGAIIAIVAVAVALGLVLCFLATCMSQRHTGHKHRGHAHKHHATSSKGPAIPLQNYRSGAGLAPPPRSHGGRARAPQFPGPRNGFAQGGHSSCGHHGPGRGPYADSSPYSAVPTWAAAGRSMYH